MRHKLEDDLPAVVRALQDELPEVRQGRPDDPRRRHPLPEPPLKLPVVLHPPVRLRVGLEVRVLALHDPAVVHPKWPASGSGFSGTATSARGRAYFTSRVWG